MYAMLCPAQEHVLHSIAMCRHLFSCSSIRYVVQAGPALGTHIWKQVTANRYPERLSPLGAQIRA